MAIPGVSHLFVDTNILVFATDAASPFQSAAETALEEWRKYRGNDGHARAAGSAYP